ncbi:MAG: response regulator [Nitrospinae bacterium]|nr:response regulator [Nitrospinota bacterium]
MEAKRRIALIVDDEVALCLALEKYLKREGFDTAIANDGQKAVSLAREIRPDLIILDVKMPEMSGDRALAEIRKFDSDSVIIMATAVEDIEISLLTLKGGADDFLRKPIMLGELLHSIQSNLEKRRLIAENRAYQKTLEFKVAEQTAELTRLYDELKITNREIILAFSEAIEAKDPYTKGHCRRVAAYSVRLGEAACVSKERLEALETGAMLHDIGKIGVGEAILNKPGKLTQEEFESVKAHPVIGYNITSTINTLRDVSRIVRNHHEHYDGSGYPDKLANTQIDIMSRIVLIADAYDAMTSDRPYRKGMPREKALAILWECSGTQFDPGLVKFFIEGKLYLITE